MGKIYCVGEALIDFIGDRACVGGAPANVAVCAALLKGKSAFIGGISTDPYGKLIYNTLALAGVDMTYAKRVSAHTALASVAIKDGDRFFCFDRNNTADLRLTRADVENIPFEEGDALHFCSNCLMDSAARDAHDAAIAAAKKKGALISFDVNLRPSLWEDEEEMKRIATAYLAHADVVKFSTEELAALINGFCEDESGYMVGDLFEKCASARCVIETRAQKGARCFFKDDAASGHIAYNDVLDMPSLNKAPVDTVGAGDCFVGATLAAITKSDLPFKSAMKEALRFAQAACALSVSRRGAIASYPTLDEVRSSKYFNAE